MASSLQPIVHNAAWIGDELQRRDEWNYAFSNAALDELLTLARSSHVAPFDSPVKSDPPLEPLPCLEPLLRQVQDRLENGSGAVRISGFPADEIDSQTAKHAFWHLCRRIGTPLSQSARGTRLFDVRDSGFAADDVRARGPNTRRKLSFHTDRCDAIGFLCYRQAKSGGENYVVSSIALYNAMLDERPDLVHVLMQPFLYQRHNVDTANERAYIEQPVFSIYEGHFAANLLRVLIERAYSMPETPDMTLPQREALDCLDELASRESLHTKFRLAHGEVLFLNNFVTLHRRTEFIDYEQDDRKRHLFRVWLSMPNSRPLDPLFAGNYGATAAGALRGGMWPQSP